MARLIIKKYKNNNDKSAAYGKTYGRLVHQDGAAPGGQQDQARRTGHVLPERNNRGRGRREGLLSEQREGHPRAIPARPEQGERVHGQDAHLKG